MPTIQAHIEKVQQSGDWFRISTDDPNVERLDTKIRKKAEEAQALKQSGELAVIEFTSRPRTDDNGKTWQNYYYEKAIAAAGTSSNGDGIEVVQQTSRKTDPGDAWRISLAAGAKLAVATLPLLPADQRDLDSQFRLAYWWGRKLFFTPAPKNEGGFSNKPAGEPSIDLGTDLDDEFVSSGNDADSDIPWD